jgi:NAD(P)-dependent dehydrogenase (short-subunit alcohol dehydrogenase family)
MPRHILVFGSTSPAGIAFCLAALRDSHTLTLYVRNASKLPTEISSAATVVVGSLDDAASIEQAVSGGAKTCVSFLGPVQGELKKGQLPITAGNKIIVPLLQKHRYTRILFLSTASYKVPQDRFSLLFSLVVWAVYLFVRGAYQEINGFTPLVASLPVDEVAWTVFRVPILKNGEAREVNAGFVGDKGVGVMLERKGLAEWVLKEMEEGEWIGKCPAVSNA